MANFTESDSFDANIYKLATVDPLLGGDAGKLNTAAQALANRTKNLDRRLKDLVFNVKDYGAIGNNVADDTAAIQAALNFAAANGGTVFLPRGNYKTTAPLTLAWSSGGTPFFGGIVGEGYASVLIGTIATSGRAVLELTGTDNVYAVGFKLSEFRILMSGGSAGAYCLKVGDAKDSFLAERLWLDGANGVSLKIASSVSYAQINTVFRQVTINSNYAAGWYNDTNNPAVNTAAVYAVSCTGSDWGGAKWDNVRFESCSFNGLVEPKAAIVEFDNCQFSTNPNRPESGGYTFSWNVAIRMGNASFKNCYFEDHKEAIVIVPGLGDIYKVSIEDCWFSGVTNYTGGSAIRCQRAIEIADTGGAYSIDQVSVTNCIFGDDPTNGYQLDAVRNAGGRAVRIKNASNWQNPGTAIRVTNDSTDNNTDTINGYSTGMSTAAPASGTWKRGDKVFNTAPSASGYMGWVCVVAGSPGTWKTFGPISA